MRISPPTHYTYSADFWLLLDRGNAQEICALSALSMCAMLYDRGKRYAYQRQPRNASSLSVLLSVALTFRTGGRFKRIPRV